MPGYDRSVYAGFEMEGRGKGIKNLIAFFLDGAADDIDMLLHSAMTTQHNECKGRHHRGPE